MSMPENELNRSIEARTARSKKIDIQLPNGNEVAATPKQHAFASVLLTGTPEEPVSRDAEAFRVLYPDFSTINYGILNDDVRSVSRALFQPHGYRVEPYKEEIDGKETITGYFVTELPKEKPQAEQTPSASTTVEPKLVGTQTLVPVKPSEIQHRREVARVFDQIVGSVPDHLLNDIVNLLSGRVDVTREELMEVAQTVVALREGTFVPPSPVDFLHAQREGQPAQIEHAKKTLRGLVASTILKEGQMQQRTLGLQMRLARETNNLAFYLDYLNGREMVVRALDDLSTAERVLLLRSMSTNLKHEFGYPDLEECDEQQMAEYIARATKVDLRQGKGYSETVSEESIERLTLLVDVTNERSVSGLRIDMIIDALNADRNVNLTYSRMIDIAEEGDFLAELEEFFSASESTRQYARRCAERRLPVGYRKYVRKQLSGEETMDDNERENLLWMREEEK